MKYCYEYICDPSYISIKAANVFRTSKTLEISFFIRGKKILSAKKVLLAYAPTEDEIDDAVKRYCIYLTGITEDYLQEKFFAEEIMGALNINRRLKKIRKKTGSGKVIWDKKY